MGRHQNDVELNFDIYILTVSEGKEQFNKTTAHKANCSTSYVLLTVCRKTRNELLILLVVIPQAQGALSRNKPSASPFQKALETVMGKDRSTMLSGSLQLAWKLLQTGKTLVLALTFILHHH